MLTDEREKVVVENTKQDDDDEQLSKRNWYKSSWYKSKYQITFERSTQDYWMFHMLTKNEVTSP